MCTNEKRTNENRTNKGLDVYRMNNLRNNMQVWGFQFPQNPYCSSALTLVYMLQAPKYWWTDGRQAGEAAGAGLPGR